MRDWSSDVCSSDLGLGKDGEEVLPTDKVRALTSYLLSMKKDDAVPYSINYSRDKKKAE